MTATKRKEVSRIDELGVRRLVEDMFKSNAQYPEIIAAVKEATGKEISDSALSRAYDKWQGKDRRIREAQMRIAALLEKITGKQDGSAAGTGLNLLMGAATERFADAMQSFEDADVLELGWLFNDAVRTSQKGEALKIQRERLELMKKKVADVADEVTKDVKAAGLSDATVAAIKQKILGVAPAS